PFFVHEPSLALTAALGARKGMTRIPRYSSVSFDNPGQAAFYGYSRATLEGRYNYQLGPSSTAYAFYAFDRTHQDRQVSTLGNVNVGSRTIGLGLVQTLNQAIVTSLSAGYETMEFERTVRRNFTGTVLEDRAT